MPTLFLRETLEPSQPSLLQSTPRGEYVTITLNQAYYSDFFYFVPESCVKVTRAVALLALPKIWNLIYVSPASITAFQKNSSDMIRELAGGGSHVATLSGSRNITAHYVYQSGRQTGPSLEPVWLCQTGPKHGPVRYTWCAVISLSNQIAARTVPMPASLPAMIPSILPVAAWLPPPADSVIISDEFFGTQ